MKKILLSSVFLFVMLGLQAQQTSFKGFELFDITSSDSKEDVDTLLHFKIPEYANSYWSELYFVMDEHKDLIINPVNQSGLFELSKHFSFRDDLNVVSLMLQATVLEVVYDREGKELILSWTYGYSRSGIYDGYELEKSGTMIISLDENIEVIADIPENYYYMFYAEGEGADTDNPDYHAKMDDNSDIEICEQSIDFEIQENMIKVLESISKKESESCDLKEPYKVGIYKYNSESKEFELD